MPVAVQITQRPLTDNEVAIVSDLDDLVEAAECSCNAGDDNPY